METLRHIMHTPRAIIRDFKVVFSDIVAFTKSFWRGYVAFFFELLDDLQKISAPFLNKELYYSVLRDFKTVLFIPSEKIFSLIKTILSQAAQKRNSLNRHLVTHNHLNVTDHPSTIPDTATDVSDSGVLYNFFLQYHALLASVYTDIEKADKANEIPSYIIASAILIFILGCIFFYLIMVFGV